MKKLLIVTTILLFGVGSVFAQSSWEVKVTWSVAFGCNFSSPPAAGEGFRVGLTVYDVANEILVIDNEYEDVPTTASEWTFNVQTAVQDHCNDNSLQYEPSFILYAAVWMGNINTQTLYCSTKTTVPDKNCSDFSSGILISGLIVD